jgi:hypothetical protein
MSMLVVGTLTPCLLTALAYPVLSIVAPPENIESSSFPYVMWGIIAAVLFIGIAIGIYLQSRVGSGHAFHSEFSEKDKVRHG